MQRNCYPHIQEYRIQKKYGKDLRYKHKQILFHIISFFEEGLKKMTLAKYLKVALISNYSEDVVLNDIKNYQKHRFPLPTFARVLKFPGYVTLQREGRRSFNCFHFFFLLLFILKGIGQFFQGAYEP